MSQQTESHITGLDDSGRWRSAAGAVFTSGHSLQVCFDDCSNGESWHDARFEHHADYGGYYLIVFYSDGSKEIVMPRAGLRVR